MLFFLIGEVPTHFISRKAATAILFHGDEESASSSKSLEISREIFTVLNSINLAINFILYYLLFAPFRKALFEMFCKTSKKELTTLKNIHIIFDDRRHSLNILKPIKNMLKTMDNGDVLQDNGKYRRISF